MSVRRTNIILGVYSFFFALAAFFTACGYRQYANKKQFLKYDFQIFTPRHILVFVLSFVLCFLLSSFLCKKIISYDDSHKQSKLSAPIVAFISFFSNMFIWGIMLLTYYPGVSMNDTVNCFFEKESDLLPVIFWFILNKSFNFLRYLTYDSMLSYAILTIVQMLLLSMIVAGFNAFLCKQGVPRILVILSVLFFSALPIIANYSIALLKDTWFSAGILMLLPALFEFLEKKDRYLAVSSTIRIILGFFLLWISRPNGKFVVLVMLAFLLLKRGKDKGLIIRTLILIPSVIIFLLLEIFLKNMYWSNVENATMREASSVALSQIAYTYAKDGSFNAEEKELLENILPKEKWIKSACFSFTDKVKFDEDFNNEYLNSHKEEFIKIWWEVFLKNPRLYFESFVFHTFGFWNLAFWRVISWDQSQSTFFSIVGNTGYDSMWGINIMSIGLCNYPLVGSTLYGILDRVYWVIVNGCILFSGGILLFAELFCFAVLIIGKRRNEAISMLPIFITWFSLMLSSPGSLIYRYVFFMLLSLPYCILILFRRKESV